MNTTITCISFNKANEQIIGVQLNYPPEKVTQLLTLIKLDLPEK